MKLLIIAHPDDELITFGPLFMSGEIQQVIVLTNPNDKRTRAFFKNCAEAGIPALSCELPDEEDNNIFDTEVVDGLGQMMRAFGTTSVVTHCPMSGDQGRHPHHIQTALMAAVAASNLSLPIEFLYYEGFAEYMRQYTIGYDQYVALVEKVNKHYGSEYVYISQSSQGYPLPRLLHTYSLDDDKLRLLINQYLAAEKNDWSVQLLYPGFDLHGTKSSLFEVEKRRKILAGAQKLIRRFPSLKKVQLLHVDVGTGKGYTTKAFNDLLGNPTLVCIDPFNKPEISCDLYFDNYADLFKFVRDKTIEGVGYKVLVSGFQALDRVSDKEFTDLVAIADYFFCESYLQENRYLACLDAFRTQKSNRSFVGLRDHLQPVAPFCDTINLLMGEK